VGYPSASRLFVFNGDFVDRGAWGCEIVLLLAALKVAAPKSVVLVRGNHESLYCRFVGQWVGPWVGDRVREPGVHATKPGAPRAAAQVVHPAACGLRGAASPLSGSVLFARMLLIFSTCTLPSVQLGVRLPS